MKRRNFIRKVPLVAGAPFAVGGVPVKLFAQQNAITRMAQQSTNDKVLVILQLHGGNDGLNAVIPVEQYDTYYSRRANIAIPAKSGVRRMIELDRTLASPDQVGLHPDMIDMKELYDMGRMKIVQGVSYERNNGSHFRGRDIWFMGGGFDDFFSSGWVGRYLQQEFAPLTYPDQFPNEDMPDPLAIEMGNDVSLIFHQSGNIPTSISLGSDPESLANLIDQLEGFEDEGLDPRGRPPEFLNNSPYGKELNWILGLEDKSEEYAGRLVEVYQNASSTTVTYPERYPFNAPRGSLRNGLSGQLQLVARLLDGGGAGLGVKTKVFLLRIGGFDNHAGQVESYDPTMGVHAARLYHIASAMKAFQADLRTRGIEDKVLTLTTSEFGRRITSNGSFGTDHGTGAPMFIFGRGVTPGMLGTNPDLSPGINNVSMQFDYRRIYANLLHDWMGVDKETITNDIFFNNFIDGTDTNGNQLAALDLANSDFITSTGDFVAKRFKLNDCYPNPARNKTRISYQVNAVTHVRVSILDQKGNLVKDIVNEQKVPGEYETEVDLSKLTAGVYLYRLETGIINETKKLVVKD